MRVMLGVEVLHIEVPSPMGLPGEKVARHVLHINNYGSSNTSNTTHQWFHRLLGREV
jgi:hypothetical protein